MIAAAAAAFEETDAEMLERLNAEMVADYEGIKLSESQPSCHELGQFHAAARSLGGKALNFAAKSVGTSR